MMRTTITIDDALFLKARELADPKLDSADLFREAIKTFIRVQAGKRLAALGGRAPQMPDVPRRAEKVSE
jgi:Arc/MetJ family transcription regulator